MLLLTLDLLGIFVFGVSGGLLAVRNQLDIVGVLVLATATGLGGGLLRDVLIGAVPPPARLELCAVTNVELSIAARPKSEMTHWPSSSILVHVSASHHAKAIFLPSCSVAEGSA